MTTDDRYHNKQSNNYNLAVFVVIYCAVKIMPDTLHSVKNRRTLVLKVGHPHVQILVVNCFWIYSTTNDYIFLKRLRTLNCNIIKNSPDLN